MLFHTNPNVKSICQRVGVANICFSTGFACEPQEKTTRVSKCCFAEKQIKVGQRKPMSL